MHLLQAAQVVVRFRLLDIYSQVFGLPTQDKLVVVPRMARPPGGSTKLVQVSFCILFGSPLSLTFHKMYDHLQDWHKLLYDFHDFFNKRSMRTLIRDDVLDPNMSSDQQQFLSGVQCICRLAHQHDEVKYSKIVVNIMTLASCVWWFSMVRLLMVLSSRYSLSTLGFRRYAN